MAKGLHLITEPTKFPGIIFVELCESANATSTCIQAQYDFLQRNRNFDFDIKVSAGRSGDKFIIVLGVAENAIDHSQALDLGVSLVIDRSDFLNYNDWRGGNTIVGNLEGPQFSRPSHNLGRDLTEELKLATLAYFKERILDIEANKASATESPNWSHLTS